MHRASALPRAMGKEENLLIVPWQRDCAHVGCEAGRGRLSFALQILSLSS